MLGLQDALREIGLRDCKAELLYENKMRSSYLLSGNLPWNCSKAVLKIIGASSVNESKFYKEPFLVNFRPKVYFVDKDDRFIVMEYVDRCDEWDKETFKDAINLMADMHSVYWGEGNVKLPKWIPRIKPVSETQMRKFYDVIEGNAIDALTPYIDTLKSGAEKVNRLFDSVLESPLTLVHGDFMYVNMGTSKSGLTLFDWSEIAIAPAAYELCYPIEHFDEVFHRQINRDFLISAYILRLKQNGIEIDENKFKRDYAVTYLYICLFRHILGYMKHNQVQQLMRKVPIVCKMISNI
jgi:thiamine kinase-like enzyme